MRFYLVRVYSTGYAAHAAFSADTLEEASRIHVDAHRSYRSASSALVMRHADGKRSSVWESEQRLKASA